MDALSTSTFRLSSQRISFLLIVLAVLLPVSATTKDCKIDLPCVETVSSTDTGLTIVQTGAGTGVYIQSSTGPALSTMSSSGEGLVGLSTSKSGVRGQSGAIGVLGSGKTGVSGSGTSFGVAGDSPSESGTGVFGSSRSGTAGKFVAGVTDTSNPHPALEGVTLGQGPAGRFKISRSDSKSPAIDVSTNGSGPAARFTVSSSASGVALDVSSKGSDGIRSVLTGTGMAGIFQVNNPNSEGSALYVTTNGKAAALRVTGSIATDVITIYGGSDVAEKFEVRDSPTPGAVVAIDPEHPGALCIARGAYNRRVAGVITGANDLHAGMVLPDLPGAKNSHPVSLSGRVWVNADATTRAIKPGDLITTAEIPGYAMSVEDYARAQGAIIGKAMTGLRKGQRGLILLLINLQ